LQDVVLHRYQADMTVVLQADRLGTRIGAALIDDGK